MLLKTIIMNGIGFIICEVMKTLTTSKEDNTCELIFDGGSLFFILKTIFDVTKSLKNMN